MAKTLAAKLCHIMESCKNIPKNGYNSFHKYKYVTAADAAEYIRQKMAEEKVIALPNVVKIETKEVHNKDKVNYLTELIMEYTFINAENPEEQYKVSMAGHGADTLDKSGYKANTGVHKYFIMQSFMLGGDDDPEIEKNSSSGSYTPSSSSNNPSQKPAPATNTGKSTGVWTGEEIVQGGKYKGQAWHELSSDYLEFLITSDKAKPDTRRNATRELARRQGVQAEEINAAFENSLNLGGE